MVAQTAHLGRSWLGRRIRPSNALWRVFCWGYANALGGGWERAAIAGYGAVFLASIVPCDKNDHFHMKQYDKDV